MKKESWSPAGNHGAGEPLDYEERVARKGIARKGEMPAHCTGQVFDICARTCRRVSGKRWTSFSTISGWNGYVGFVKESTSCGRDSRRRRAHCA